MKRKKASDSFNESVPFIGEKKSFEETFPMIAELSATVVEFKNFRKISEDEYPIEHYYGHNDLPCQFIDCTNTLCNGGGFSIGSILSKMTSERMKSLEGTVDCLGKEGKRSGRNCTHLFEYKIKIIYKT